MTATKKIARIEFTTEDIGAGRHAAIAIFVFIAGSESVSETTIKVGVPWNGDLAAAEKAAVAGLKDFGAGLA